MGQLLVEHFLLPLPSPTMTWTHAATPRQRLTVCTFGATQCHNQRAVALVQLPEAGASGSVSDDRQLFQDESLQMKRRKWKMRQNPALTSSAHSTKKTFLVLEMRAFARYEEAAKPNHITRSTLVIQLLV